MYFYSVAKTGRCLVTSMKVICLLVLGQKIVSRIQQSCFDYLSAPILRVTNRDVPQPYATVLEQEVMPNPSRVVEAAEKVLAYK